MTAESKSIGTFGQYKTMTETFIVQCQSLQENSCEATQEIAEGVMTQHASIIKAQAQGYDREALRSRISLSLETDSRVRVEIRDGCLVFSVATNEEASISFVPSKQELYILDAQVKSYQKGDKDGKYLAAINLIYSYIERAKDLGGIDEFLICFQNYDLENLRYFCDRCQKIFESCQIEFASLNSKNDSLLFKLKKVPFKEPPTLFKPKMKLDSFSTPPKTDFISRYVREALGASESYADAFVKLKPQFQNIETIFRHVFAKGVDVEVISRMNEIKRELILKSTDKSSDLKEIKNFLVVLSLLTKNFQKTDVFFETLTSYGDPIKDFILKLCGFSLPKQKTGIFSKKNDESVEWLLRKALLPSGIRFEIDFTNQEYLDGLKTIPVQHPQNVARFVEGGYNFQSIQINGLELRPQSSETWTWDAKKTVRENQTEFFRSFLQMIEQTRKISGLNQDSIEEQLSHFMNMLTYSEAKDGDRKKMEEEGKLPDFNRECWITKIWRGATIGDIAPKAMLIVSNLQDQKVSFKADSGYKSSYLFDITSEVEFGCREVRKYLFTSNGAILAKCDVTFVIQHNKEKSRSTFELSNFGWTESGLSNPKLQDRIESFFYQLGTLGQDGGTIARVLKPTE